MELAKDFRQSFFGQHALKDLLRDQYRMQPPRWLISKATRSIDEIHEVGPSGPWKLTKAPRVYQKYGHDRVDLYFVDPTKPNARPIEVVMECKTDPRTDECSGMFTESNT